MEGRSATSPGASPICSILDGSSSVDLTGIRGPTLWTRDHVREGVPLKGTGAGHEVNPTAEATLLSGHHLPGHTSSAQERILAAGPRLALLGRVFSRLRFCSNGERNGEQESNQIPSQRACSRRAAASPEQHWGGGHPTEQVEAY